MSNVDILFKINQNKLNVILAKAFHDIKKESGELIKKGNKGISVGYSFNIDCYILARRIDILNYLIKLNKKHDLSIDIENDFFEDFELVYNFLKKYKKRNKKLKGD